ncbi:hypothetical protein ACQUQU_01085 [Thalassolituus sp. LLYu03]|uniref:hypothetical protein n=1 Tax=Thalassolituus sp. LLYu03 TaxID=3421656 RepID=UPI003D2DAE65
MLKRISVFLLSAYVLTGCVSLNSVSQTAIPADRNKQVSADSSQWSLLGIAFSNGFVNVAVDDLKAQCPDGKVQGILTKFDSVFFFPVLVRRVNVEGFCLSGSEG